MFGGRILKTRVSDAWHFYNEIAGEIHDFTAQQFDAPIEYMDEAASRDEALADTSLVQYQRMADEFRRNWDDEST